MKDLFGNDLVVGDVVAFNEPGYKNLTTGVILKVTPKGVTIEYMTFSKYKKTTNESFSNVVKKII